MSKLLPILTVLALLMALAIFVHTGQAGAATDGDRVRSLSDAQLAREARKAVRNGGIYSTRWGDASPYLKKLSRELVVRGFQRHGTVEWALYIVNRESGFNPGAVNRYSGCTGLAQFDPGSHRWVNYKRMKSDPAYAVAAFVRLSRGGRHQSPWYL